MSTPDPDLAALNDEETAALEQYRTWCGDNPGRTGQVSLMDPGYREMMRWWVEEHCPEALLLWQDGDASNCAGVYVSGPMRGMVFLLMHDEEDVSPEVLRCGELRRSADDRHRRRP